MNTHIVSNNACVIISTTERANDVDNICYWLNYYKKKYIRFSNLNEMKIYNDYTHGYILENRTTDISIKFSDIDSYYFLLNSIYDFYNINNNNNNYDIQSQIKKQMNGEMYVLFYYLISKLDIKKRIGSISNKILDFNKLNSLEYALEVGLRIPEYDIINCKNHLIKLKEKWGNVIFKDFNRPIYIKTQNLTSLPRGTTLITDELINSIDETFHSTFVQKYIEKKFDIRAIYIDNHFYSIIYYSQQSEETKIDVRNMNGMDRKIRAVPFNIPFNIETKLKKLIKKFELNYAAIDMVYSTDNNYYFLEINTDGIYTYVSHVGNYNIDKKIAKYLK